MNPSNGVLPRRVLPRIKSEYSGRCILDKQVIWQCSRDLCSFRFPLPAGTDPPRFCPRCGYSDLSPEQYYPSQHVLPGRSQTSASILEALLDNIRSAYNTGAIIRTADGAGVRRLHLCGMTALPYDGKVAKTALGAEQAVPWVYYENSFSAAGAIHSRGGHLWALEGGEGSIPITEARALLPSGNEPLVLVIGSEVGGVDPAVLDLCERRIYLPMQGVKNSLNVSVAFGIAVYFLNVFKAAKLE